MKNVFERLAPSKQVKPSKDVVAAVFMEFQLLPLEQALPRIAGWEAEGRHERTDDFVGEVSHALAVASGDGIADQGALTLLLRAVPGLIVDRRRAVSASLTFCAHDREAQAFVKSADNARDRGDWGAGEYAYWRVLSLFPLHPGYHVQYGHCLKEQGKYIDAEINYRTALALGDVEGDLAEHITFVAARRNQPAFAPTLARIVDFWRRGTKSGALQVPPTRDDVLAIYNLFLGGGPSSLEEMASILSESANLRDVLSIIFSKPDFVSVNRHLLAYLVESGWPK